jgi:transposase
MRGAYKLSVEACKRILDALQMGASFEVAGRFAGISGRTLSAWNSQGRADIEQGIDSEYARLSEAIELARGEAGMKYLRNIENAIPKDWRAAAYKLERMFPEYAKSSVTINNTNNNSAEAGITVSESEYDNALHSVTEVVAQIRRSSTDQSGRALDDGIPDDGYQDSTDEGV